MVVAKQLAPQNLFTGRRVDLGRYSSGLERGTANACAQAVTWGFENVYYFENGLQKWKAADYTLAAGN